MMSQNPTGLIYLNSLALRTNNILIFSSKNPNIITAAVVILRGMFHEDGCIRTKLQQFNFGYFVTNVNVIFIENLHKSGYNDKVTAKKEECMKSVDMIAFAGGGAF